MWKTCAISWCSTIFQLNGFSVGERLVMRWPKHTACAPSCGRPTVRTLNCSLVGKISTRSGCFGVIPYFFAKIS